MKKLLLIHFIIFTVAAHAQVYRDRIGFDLESIEHIDFGWMKIYKYPSPATGKRLAYRTYSAAQIGYCQQFIEWMQQSYLPKGCLGNAGYYQNTIPKFSSTNSRHGNAVNMHAQALPNLYGAYSKMYMFLKKDAAGKFVPQNNLGEFWQIEANQIQYISSPVSFISDTAEYYFVLPNFEGHSKGYDDDDKAAGDFKGFRNHKNIAPYTHFYIPPKIISDNPFYVVIMTKDNTLPFENVTIGEFFTEAEKKIPFWQSIDPVSPAQLETARKHLARLKEKYKNKWNDVARLKLSETQIDLWDFVNATEEHEDFFDNRDSRGVEGVYTTFPILKVKKGVRELCKTGGPQWLVIRWTAGMPNSKFNVHMHESILNNFNFEYAYNYFFHPEKVKGQPYMPLHSPAGNNAVAQTEAQNH